MNQIDNTLNQIYGKPCWGISYDCNVNLSMSFGDPMLTIREPFKPKSSSPGIREWASSRQVTIKGKWWLWVFCSYWKLSFDGERAASGASSFRQIQIALAKLSGQILTQAVINPHTGATRFEFDLGGTLDVRRFDRQSKHDLWMLYKPSGYVLTIRGDGRYSHQRRSDHAEKMVPIPA